MSTQKIEIKLDEIISELKALNQTINSLIPKEQVLTEKEKESVGKLAGIFFKPD